MKHPARTLIRYGERERPEPWRGVHLSKFRSLTLPVPCRFLPGRDYAAIFIRKGELRIQGFLYLKDLMDLGIIQPGPQVK